MVAPRKIGEFVWELPIGTVPGMHVPGRIFASEALMQKAIEDKAVQQVANVATLPGIVSASLAMPDIHWGYGFPIGGVAATDVERGGVISPGGVGFDIGCGVRLLRSDLTYEADVEPRLRALVDMLGDRVPRGVGGRGRMPLRGGEVDQVLRKGARFAVERGAGWDQDLESCESGGTLPGAEPDFVSPRAKQRGAPQLGSLGAGNHFVEVQVVDEIRDAAAASAMELFQGQVCVMIHSGSRGIGHQTCTDHLRVIDRLQTKLGYALPDRQLACVPFGHDVARSYVGAMGAAGNFALANRQVLADAVRESWALLFGRPPQALGLRLVYDVAHNLAKIEEHLVEGQRRRVCVHRKGATRACGPGDADLPPRYAAIGQPVIIPGSMGTASFVLAGTARARDLSFASTCHGAGRAMSRTKAKQVMSGQALREKLEDEGILLARSHWALLSEEAPYAYKSAADVVETCEGVGLSRVVARLRPVAVVKG